MSDKNEKRHDGQGSRGHPHELGGHAHEPHGQELHGQEVHGHEPLTRGPNAEEGGTEEISAAGEKEQELGALESAERERAEYLDALRRTKAEYENYRKRVQRELADTELRAKGQVIAEFLPILDNLDRALEAAEHHEEGKVIEGVRLTHDLFVELLRKEGVEEMDPRGEPFDPRLHEAMISQPSDEDEGTVTAVFERGYCMSDRVLRPARVAVSQGRGDGDDDA